MLHLAARYADIWHRALTASPRQIAAGLRAFHDAGFAEVQVWLQPPTSARLETFAPVLDSLAHERG
jgi:hypothetical protein